jgi:hypothetical protein
VSYPRENTRQVEATGAANGVTTLKLPNASTVEPGDETPVGLPGISVNQRYRIRFVHASFGAAAAPTTPVAFTITDGVFTYTFDITGPLVLTNIDWQCAPGAEVTMTLAAGGASLVGHINTSVVVEG